MAVSKKRKNISKAESFLTDVIIDRIARVVEIGAYIETACYAVGMRKSEYQNWMIEGENESALISSGDLPRHGFARRLKFYTRLKEAEAKAEHSLIAIIMKSATSGQWHAAAWLLERARPSRWAKKTEYAVTAGKIEESKEPTPAMARELFEMVMGCGKKSGKVQTKSTSEKKRKEHSK